MPHAVTQPPGWKNRVKAHRGSRYAYQAGVFLLGLVIILACMGLWTVLPAPLAIPPMLIGVSIWATEFPFAGSLLDWLKDKAQTGRDYAKAHPVKFGLMTTVSLLVAVAGYWAFFQFA